jgi:hypothetical protein
MTKFRALLAAILAFVVPLAHADTWRDYINVTTTEFSQWMQVNGKLKDRGTNLDRYFVTMMAAVSKKTGEVEAAGIYVQNTYAATARHGWNRATTSRAEQLEVSNDGGKSSCSGRVCSIDESVTIFVPLNVFQRAVTEATRIRMTGRGDDAEFIFDIDPREAGALLEAIEDTGAALRSGK